MGQVSKKTKLKLFTSQNGKFQMYIPINWEYKNPSFYKSDINAPESFGQYTRMIGSFQISCKLVNDHIAEIIKANALQKQSSDLDALTFKYKFVETGNSQSYMWICSVDDHFILVTYIVESKKLATKRGIEELKQAREAAATIKFIKPQFRDIIIAQNRFSMFMSSIATTIDLRNKAIKNGSFIEFVALTANHIDSLLRLALILTTQFENKNEDIDISVLFQSQADKPIMEKDIYKKVLNRKIIDQKTYDELFELYNERNKVIHRFIITDIRTRDIMEIASRFDELDDKIWDLVNNIEKKQFEEKVGIHGHDIPPGRRIEGEELERLKYRIKDKHGKIKWPDNKV